MPVIINTGEKQTRDRSAIAFPYTPLDEAINVVRAVLNAGGSLDRDQLAAQLGQTTKSGAFNNKVSAAQMFGLLEVANGKYQPSDLGYEVLDPARERAAKASAFLCIPLYRRLYDEFKGKQLPPRPEGLERAMVNLGVAPKRGTDARLAFDKSARSAGYFPNAAEDRLVAPVVGPMPSGVRISAPEAVAIGNAASEAAVPAAAPAPRGLNPFIEGLLDEIPEKGAPWSLDDQANWLQAAAQIFRILYKGDGEIIVTVRKAGQ